MMVEGQETRSPSVHSDDRRIGVVGRERSWRDRIAGTLRRDGWEVSAHEDPPSNPMGFRALMLHAPSFGQAVTAIIHRLTYRPALFVFSTAATSDERARWVRAGASAVLETKEKPARLLASLWRAATARGRRRRRITAGPFKVDLGERRAWAGDRELELTRTELSIFYLLVRHANYPVSHDDIRGALIGGADRVETSAVRTHMRNLRRKLGDCAVLLETVAPRLYRLRSRLPAQPPRGTEERAQRGVRRKRKR